MPSNLNLTPVTTYTYPTTAGAVGTYCVAYDILNHGFYLGQTVPGSYLGYLSDGATSASYNYTGTWRCLGFHNAAAYDFGTGALFLRIS